MFFCIFRSNSIDFACSDHGLHRTARTLLLSESKIHAPTINAPSHSHFHLKSWRHLGNILKGALLTTPLPGNGQYVHVVKIANDLLSTFSAHTILVYRQ